MRGYKLLFLLVSCAVSVVLSAQDRKQLEHERMQVIESIEQTDVLIQASENDRQKSLATLSALRGQIAQRNALLDNIKKSISQAELEIESNYIALDDLTRKVEVIEKQYGALLRSKYVKKLTSSKWLTILSAKSINEAFLRWNYSRQFESYRVSKIDELNTIKATVDIKNEEIKKYALDNSALIQQQQIQNSELQSRIAQQNDLVKELQKDKTILQSQLSAIKDARESLNQAIESRVLGELSGDNIGSARVDASRENIAIVKGEVLLPITNGYIEDLSIDNNDKNKTLSIYAAKGASVIAIAPGKVISTKEVEGYGKMIILQHGEYYSIYANLKNVSVAIGKEVVKNTKLGSVGTDESKLHFELWKDKVRLDANEWMEQ